MKWRSGDQLGLGPGGDVSRSRNRLGLHALPAARTGEPAAVRAAKRSTPAPKEPAQPAPALSHVGAVLLGKFRGGNLVGAVAPWG